MPVWAAILTIVSGCAALNIASPGGEREESKVAPSVGSQERPHAEAISGVETAMDEAEPEPEKAAVEGEAITAEKPTVPVPEPIDIPSRTKALSPSGESAGLSAETAEEPVAAEVDQKETGGLQARHMDLFPAGVEDWPELSRLPVPDRPEVAWQIEQIRTKKRRTFILALKRSGRYLPMIFEVFEQKGLPKELAYLPLVESHFIPDAESRARAVGLWQFISSTGRLSDLRVDWWVDERLDPVRSTHAAADHLIYLYERFKDWELALAAYNAGTGKVARALRKAGASDFWAIAQTKYLKKETKLYVPKFYAAVEVAKDPAKYGIDPGELHEPVVTDSVRVGAPIDLAAVAKMCGKSVREIASLNPALKRNCTPPGSTGYSLNLPAGTAVKVAEGIKDFPESERLTFLRHKVRPGDNLLAIAKRYGTKVKPIVELNDISNPRLIREGSELVVPVRSLPGAEGSRKPRIALADRLVHVVRSGETLWGIASGYEGVSVGDILVWNKLGPRELIFPGDRLAVSPPGG